MLFVLVLIFLASVAKGFYFSRELTCDFEDFHYFYSLFYFIYFLNLRFVVSHDLDLLCPISLFCLFQTKIVHIFLLRLLGKRKNNYPYYFL